MSINAASPKDIAPTTLEAVGVYLVKMDVRLSGRLDRLGEGQVKLEQGLSEVQKGVSQLIDFQNDSIEERFSEIQKEINHLKVAFKRAA